MSYIRLYFKENLSLNLNLNLDKSQSHYISKVMRIKEGSNFCLFNTSGEWIAKVKEIKKGIVNFTVVKKLRNSENELDIWLAFAPVKLNYLNFMIQKATELGVTKFIPILSDRTIVRKINRDRINRIIIEATEQSNRTRLPKLENLMKFNDFLKVYKYTNIIFGDLNSNNKKLKINNKKLLCILIGPEGDYTEVEREKILKYSGTQSIKLGNTILRTETAVISALSVINFLKN